jgi:hypothetical protein
VTRHQAVGDVDLAEFFQIFQPRKTDLFARTFEDAGATAKAVFPLVGDRMIDQYLPSLFDIAQPLIGNEP